MKKITLHTSDLLSKWGFCDGDILDDFIWDNDYEYKVLKHKLLFRLVKKFLLPKLNHKIEVCFFDTIHNPVRAEMIDGIDYSNWFDDDEWDNKLKPESVEIKEEDIIKEIKKMIKG